jgi:hypothetical protein
VRSFEEDLADESLGVVADFSSGIRTAVVAFGGNATRMGGLPPFEFFHQLDGVTAGRVFIRDLDQSWYQLGIRGAGDDVAASATWLQRTLQQHDIERAVCVGCSAGGFAAIVFGGLLGASEIYAFNPQTTISRRGLWKVRDGRWNVYLEPMRKQLGDRQPVFDARSVVARASNRPRIFVHWGKNESRDKRHALRLRGVPNVELVPHDGLGHSDLTRALRDTGELRELLVRAVR